MAEAYLGLMFDLGVDINLSKSLVSNQSIGEFAKRLIGYNMEVTPVGAKSLSALLVSEKNLPIVLLDLMGKGFCVTEEYFKSLLESKSLPPVMAKRLPSIGKYLLGPLGVFTESEDLTPFLSESAISSLTDHESVILKDCILRVVNDHLWRERLASQENWTVYSLTKRSMVKEMKDYPGAYGLGSSEEILRLLSNSIYNQKNVHPVMDPQTPLREIIVSYKESLVRISNPYISSDQKLCSEFLSKKFDRYL